MKNRKSMAFILIILAGLLWGTSAIFVHFLTPLGVTSMQMTFVRGAVSTVVIGIYVLISNKRLFKARISDMPFYIVSGICMMMASVFYYLSMQRTCVSTSVVLLYVAPVYVMIYSVLFLREKFNWIKGITLEYFNLKNQSGPIYHDSNSLIPDQISCADNNYWHHTYNGWFNYGMMIGTPLITSPVYNTDGTLRIYNNRVEAFHMGIEGALLKWLNYRLLLTKSNNWGTYSIPFTEMKKNTSGLFELTFKPNKAWNIKASFAFDSGKLYGNNYGGMITVSRCDIFKF